MKPVLLTDVDGVIADYNNFYLERGIKLGFVKNSIHDMYSDYDPKDILNLTDLEHEQIMADGWPNEIKPFDGVVEAIKNLMDIADVYFVTAPHRGVNNWAKLREDWLCRYFGEKNVRIVSTKYKYLVGGDIFIDDRLDKVKSWSESHSNGVSVLWAQKYNEPFKDNGFVFTSSWDLIANIIKKL